MNNLAHYKEKGSFVFKHEETLTKACNAPKNKGGVYFVFNANDNSILYIGASGWVNQDGTFGLRKGGMYDRIVNGKHFDNIKRAISWPLKMRSSNILEIRVDWYITFDNNIKYIPSFVEACCIQDFFEKHSRLPEWNKDF